jgi:cbb3-type cytochrome oxidase cytochrome c subunit
MKIINFWKKCDWVERGMVFGVPALVVIVLSVAYYIGVSAQIECEEVGGSYEKDETYTVVQVRVRDVYVPWKVYGHHCVLGTRTRNLL